MDKRCVVSAVAGAVVGVGVFAAVTRWQAKTSPSSSCSTAVTSPKSPPSPASETETTGPPRDVDSDAEKALMAEQLSRNVRFFGSAQDKVQASFVVVVGMGGVGSHAAHMLARSGVSKIRLIDFDNVTLSSLNRHAVAVRADVGKPKVRVMKSFIAAFSPTTEVDARPTLFNAEAAEDLLSGNPDYVLDCIDDMKTKVQLLVHCRRNGIPVLSAMGAGAKADPTRIHISDIYDVIQDPMASRLRTMLRKEGVDKVTAVYSSELPTRALCPLEGEAAESPEEFGAMEHFRVRILPVVGTTPAIFGNAMAAYVLCKLADDDMSPSACPQIWQRKTINSVYKNLVRREREVFDNPDGVEFREAEVELMMKDMWRYHSAVSSRRTGLMLTRWDAAKPPVMSNMVPVTLQEAKKLEAGDTSAFGPEIKAAVEERLVQIARWSRS